MKASEIFDESLKRTFEECAEPKVDSMAGSLSAESISRAAKVLIDHGLIPKIADTATYLKTRNAIRLSIQAAIEG